MKIGIVGAGILGLGFGHRLSRLGHSVSIFEAGAEAGGLACSHDYGRFRWDRFYHCILPQDTALCGLLNELGLGGELRWTRTGTGYWGGGRFHDMSGNRDFLHFPLLSLVDKARLGAAVLWATRVADPWALYRITAEEWLIRMCGRRGYEVFWRPLLKAKFGPFYDCVAAVFIWATLKRLTGARSSATAREKLGYVAGGGYARIVARLDEALRARGATVRLSSPVTAIAEEPGGGCAVSFRDRAGGHRESFDQVFFTGPTGLAAKVVAPSLLAHVERTARDYPTSEAYLGVACVVLALTRPLANYYVLNIGDDRIRLTGVIEMTNLIDRRAETDGLHLVYLPRYLAADDPRFDAPDEELLREAMDEGLLRLFPDLLPSQIAYSGVHRARFVQPLPLVRAGGAGEARLPSLAHPFQVLNTSMLSCATLNNNEVVSMVDRFVENNRGALAAVGRERAAAPRNS